MYLVFTRMPGESFRRRLRSLLLYLCDVFRALINSLVCWFWTSALGLVLFQICYSGINVTSSLLLLVFVVFPTYSQLSVRKRSSSPNSMIPKQLLHYYVPSLHQVSYSASTLKFEYISGIKFSIYAYVQFKPMRVSWQNLSEVVAKSACSPENSLNFIWAYEKCAIRISRNSIFHQILPTSRPGWTRTLWDKIVSSCLWECFSHIKCFLKAFIRENCFGFRSASKMLSEY